MAQPGPMPVTAARTSIVDLVALTVLALLARTAAALLVPGPPHVDAAYYTLVAERLADGHGFSVPVLWSFLEVGGGLPADPSLPVPSNGHWRPLPSILATGPMALLDGGWRAGQLIMVLLSTLLVPATYLIGWQLWRSRRVALLGALLAVLAGPLLVMYPLVETFAVFGVAGATALYASVRAVDALHPGRWLVLAGAAAGLASLARIDGVLLTVAPATAWLVSRPFGIGPFGSPARALAWGSASAVAFLVVLGPWLVRDLLVFGTPFPSAGGHTLWIREYNEQFSIASDPTPATYLAWGPLSILASKLSAAVQVVGSTLAVMGGIFGILFLAGLWLHRRDRRLAPFIIYVVVLFAAMALIFTVHAPRGAFVHSAPAWLPFAFPMAIASLPTVAGWAGRAWRLLRRPASHRLIEMAGLVGALVLSLAGGAGLLLGWSMTQDRYEAAARFLSSEADAAAVVMSADPARLNLLTANPGVPAPFDPYPVIEKVVEAYDVDWLVVVLPPGESRDPLGLWEGANATDIEGNHPDWLPAEAAFEADGVRVFDVAGPGG